MQNHPTKNDTRNIQHPLRVNAENKQQGTAFTPTHELSSLVPLQQVLS